MLANSLRDNLDRAKKKKSAKEDLIEGFNDASITLIKQFIANVNSGTIQIDDTADLMRLFNIYTQVNDIQSGAASGNGAPPALSRTRKEVMEDMIPSDRQVVNGEEEDIIDLDALIAMSAEDIQQLMTKREVEVNRENEAAF